MDRYICIHGHFYQPPRDNPWLEAIELQDSAAPFHDWNARITAECYAPNTAARILDGQGRIAAIVNNYACISFNVGPTLLAWLEAQAPATYQAILAADRASQARFGGHGSAIAQAYNHLILPLANRRDKATQVSWGIQDFVQRFGRQPEGMWLPETAVDLETLELLAEHGIRFTILSPSQARRVRPLAAVPAAGATGWIDVADGRIDPSMPYTVCLPSGRTIAIFFYDAPIARAVAFEGVLTRGEALAERLMGAFSATRSHPQLVHIATDGESYGHHHPHGDMALAYALAEIERQGRARLTNYGEFLARHPPTHEVEIVEASSWSCCHGIERWRHDCGCNGGGQRGWRQAWRGPLRAALDWLRDTIAPHFEQRGRALLHDPWVARDAYIAVVLDRSPERIATFLARHALGSGRGSLPCAADQTTILQLMELQRHAQLMYTSCGWFFDELSGIETVQVLQYAGRVIQLAAELFAVDLLPAFLERLEQAPSNLPAYRTGRHVYERFVSPAVVDLATVTAHYALRALFDDADEETALYCYRIERQAFQRWATEPLAVAVGRVRVTSAITGESAVLRFGVLHQGEHDLICGVRPAPTAQRERRLGRGLAAAVDRADGAEVVRLLHEQVGPLRYTLTSLFRDEQRQIVDRMVGVPLAEVEAAYHQIYARYLPLLRFLTDVGAPVPQSVTVAAEVALGTSLRQALTGALDVHQVRTILEEARQVGITLDGHAGVGGALEQTLERVAEQLQAQPTDLARLQAFAAVVDLTGALPGPVNVWNAQNIYDELRWTVAPAVGDEARAGDEEAGQWIAHFTALGETLGFGEAGHPPRNPGQWDGARATAVPCRPLLRQESA